MCMWCAIFTFSSVVLFRLAFSQIFIGTKSVIKVTASVSEVILQTWVIVTPQLAAKDKKAVILVHLEWISQIFFEELQTFP